ncbi:hypothetical protein [Streptomyces tricolor]|uniref:hypothetical protein n=1 Tax=Streptomyces tricolor TaxID=68277 RepID=UPI0036EDCB1E
MPTALARIRDPDPVARSAATDDALREVTHRNTVCEAAVPVALLFATILQHPASVTGDFGNDAGMPPRRPGPRVRPPRRPTVGAGVRPYDRRLLAGRRNRRFRIASPSSDSAKAMILVFA